MFLHATLLFSLLQMTNTCRIRSRYFNWYRPWHLSSSHVHLCLIFNLYLLYFNICNINIQEDKVSAGSFKENFFSGNGNHSCWTCQYPEYFYPKALIHTTDRMGEHAGRSEHRLEHDCLKTLNQSIAMNTLHKLVH